MGRRTSHDQGSQRKGPCIPKSLVVPFTWLYAPNALSLSDAVNDVSQHEERNAWGQASQIKLVPGINYPNQPERNQLSEIRPDIATRSEGRYVAPDTIHGLEIWTGNVRDVDGVR